MSAYLDQYLSEVAHIAQTLDRTVLDAIRSESLAAAALQGALE